MRLAQNSILNRARQVANSLQRIVNGLDKEDQKLIIRQALESMGFEDEQALVPEAPSQDIGDKILAAIHTGLDQGNAQVIRAAMDYEAERAGRDYLKDLAVNIVPYRVKDASLEKIIREADLDVVKTLQVAITQRLGDVTL